MTEIWAQSPSNEGVYRATHVSPTEWLKAPIAELFDAVSVGIAVIECQDDNVQL